MSAFGGGGWKINGMMETTAATFHTESAKERVMRVEEVIVRAYAKKISWIQAAEILGYSARHMRRLREQYDKCGIGGLFDGRVSGQRSNRVPVKTIEEVLRLYREEYFDFNLLHFHERLKEKHSILVSYTWVRNLLQTAGLVERERPRKKHRRKRERKPVAGMMLHIDGSHHQWFTGDDRFYDLIVILDDANSEIYYAQIVGDESTRTIMAAIREVVEIKGVFCSLYSDRASHFFLTPKAGEAVDKKTLTQVGRALKELGIRAIPAYSPQARGRSERSFRTWQGRLPQELRLKGIKTVEEANAFLRNEFIGEFNRRFKVESGEKETAFVVCQRNDLDRVFSIQTERTVNKDNTVRYKSLVLQIEKQSWRRSMEGCKVIVYEHLDATISIGYGPQEIGRFTSSGKSAAKAETTKPKAQTKANSATSSN
jgi:transposase